MAATLHQILPWTAKPLIINAPLAGFAGPDLAVAVSKVGGLGQIGADFNLKALEHSLSRASSALREETTLDCSKTMPIGVGLLLFILNLDEVLPIVSKYKPAVIWLFAAKNLDDYTTWATRLREVSPDSKVCIQVGSVAAALQIAKSSKPDFLILQGIDAGGHGFERGAGIISLLPEAMDTLERNGLGHIPLVASGGIVDGRGVAAAYALGAQGVVMGTRFLAAKETVVHPKYQSAVLEAIDGGQSTARAKVFDELGGPSIWPLPYDGRSLANDSYNDHRNGVSIEKIRELHNEAKQDQDLGYGSNQRVAIWAGTGVGLVTRVESAGDIVDEVRKDAILAIDKAKSRL